MERPTLTPLASFVDTNYSPQKDFYDALINMLFPIFFVILLNVTAVKPRSIKNVVFDLLCNIITWIIPLTVSLSYDDLLGIMIFSIVIICLHIICAVTVIIKNNDLK